MQEAPQLSVVIICLNEAAQIQRCVRSVAFADEVIVLDGGSADDTAALTRAAGARVEVDADWQGFGVQKNRALALARGRWVLSLDADECVPAALAAEIQAAVARDQGDVYELPRRTQFCGEWIDHCGWTPDRVARLFRRGAARFSDDRVHERSIWSAGHALRLKTPLEHYSYTSTAVYWRKLQDYSAAWAQERYQAGVRTTMGRAALSAFVAFVRAYIWRLGFLDGAMGFAVCTMQAHAAFAKYFELYALHAGYGRPVRASKNGII